MKLIKKLAFASSLLAVTMTGCSVDQSLPISNKNFSNFTFTEVTADEGLYGDNDGFIGNNAQELGEKVKGKLTYNGTLKVTDVPTTGYTYNGSAVKVYPANEHKEGEITVGGYYVLATEKADEFTFLTAKGGGSMELVAPKFSLGYRESTSGGTSGSVTTIKEAYLEIVGNIKYNKADSSLSLTVKATHRVTIDDDTTTKTGDFTVSLKA